MNIRTSIEQKRGCGHRHQGGLYLVSGGLFDACHKLPIPLTVCPCCHAGVKPSRGWTWVGYQLIKDAPCSKPGCTGCHPFDGSIQKFGLLWIGEKFYKHPYDFNKEALGQGISRRIANVPKDFVLGETWVLLAHRKGIREASDILLLKKDDFEPGPEEGIEKDLYAHADEDGFFAVAITKKTRGIKKYGDVIAERLTQATGISFTRDSISQHVFHADKNALNKMIWEKDMFNYTKAIFCVFKPTAIEYVVKDDDTEEYLESLEKRGISLVKVIKEEDAQLELKTEEHGA